MAEILDEFQLTSKVTACITDNAANMAKAMTFLADADCSNSSDIDSGVEHKDDGMEMIRIGDLLLQQEEELVENSDEEYFGQEHVTRILHKKHIRCACHTLNLVAAVDSRAARSDNEYKRMSDKALAKVQALSDAVNRSVKHAVIVNDIVGVTFLNPTCTRWSSEFSAVSRIVSVGLEKVRECQQKIGLPTMTEGDMKYLTGFVRVMKPIAVAMEFLQGEKDCYVGHVIPTITGIQKQEGPPIGGAVRNATSLIPQPLAYIIFAIACLENVHALPCIDSRGQLYRDNNMTPAIYVMHSNRNEPAA